MLYDTLPVNVIDHQPTVIYIWHIYIYIAILHKFSDHFGITFELFWNHFGINSTSIWDVVGINSTSIWDVAGISFGSTSDKCKSILKPTRILKSH